MQLPIGDSVTFRHTPRPTPAMLGMIQSNWGGATPLRHSISLFFVLSGTWLLLSGRLEALPLILGAISCLFVIYLARRMDVIDGESHPIHLGFRLPGYWFWLGWQIFKANFDVARRILDPRMPIEPHLFELEPEQSSDLGRVIYANSITLTPGTVTTDLSTDRIQVHALSDKAERELRGGEMAAKIAGLEISP